MFGKPCAEEMPSLYIIRCSRKLVQGINPIGPWALRDIVQNILLGSYVWGDPISSMGPWALRTLVQRYDFPGDANDFWKLVSGIPL